MIEYIPQLAEAVAVCIPSAAVGLIVWRMEKKMERGFQAQADREKVREENEVLLVQATGAAIALGEATAMALKTAIPMEKQRRPWSMRGRSSTSKKDFLTRQAAKNDQWR